MTERYYKVYLLGYGGEHVIGTLTKEQYDFWKDLEEEDIINHAFWDPWDESDENPVFDDTDPRFLGNWYDLDDLMHENGVSAENALITIEEVDSSDYDAKILETLIENVSWEEFVEKYNISLGKDQVIDLEETMDYTEYTFHGFAAEKGCLGVYVIKTDSELDINKLNFCLTHVPNTDTILELIDYAGQDVDREGGDTIGKGYYASVQQN